MKDDKFGGHKEKKFLQKSHKEEEKVPSYRHHHNNYTTIEGESEGKDNSIAGSDTEEGYSVLIKSMKSCLGEGNQRSKHQVLELSKGKHEDDDNFDEADQHRVFAK